LPDLNRSCDYLLIAPNIAGRMPDFRFGHLRINRPNAVRAETKKAAPNRTTGIMAENSARICPVRFSALLAGYLKDFVELGYFESPVDAAVTVF
jgi:hypothetical protein